MFTNEDFFKVITTFFITTTYFIVTLFFGSFLGLSANSLVKEFVVSIVILSLTSIIIFPAHFVIFPFYKHYWVNGEKNNSNYWIGVGTALLTLLIEFLVAFWIIIMLAVILYYPLYKNVLGIL